MKRSLANNPAKSYADFQLTEPLPTQEEAKQPFEDYTGKCSSSEKQEKSEAQNQKKTY